MGVRGLLICTVAILLGLALAPPSRAADEFAGPFASWADVKRDHGAVGDGKTDDTAAIQKGLDDLRQHRKHCVLFFPAGTYRITQTVQTVRKAHFWQNRFGTTTDMGWQDASSPRAHAALLLCNM